MAGDPHARLLVRVPAAELPPRVRALLDPDTPRPADSRFQVRRQHPVWVPVTWLVALLVVGHASTRYTVAAWWDPAGAAARIIYGGMAATCLFFAVVSVYRLAVALNERREVKLGRYRQGLHVLGSEGLLVAGSELHTWVPRPLLPAPVDVTSRGGGGTVKSYAYFFDDGHGRVERFDCGVLTESALWMWAEQGRLPAGDDWR